MLDLGFIHALKQIVRLLPAKRQTLFFSATMPKAIKELADKFLTDPAPGLGRAAVDHGRAGRAICQLRPADREAGPADDDAARRLFRARQHGPGADLHPHQARRRPGREAARRQRHPRQRHPRQQEPAAARARAGRVQGRQGQDPGRDRHRRARHRRLGRQPRDQFRAAQRLRAICPPHRAHRAGRRGRSRHRLTAPRTSAPISRASRS